MSTTDDVARLRADKTVEGGGDDWRWSPLRVVDFEARVDGIFCRYFSEVVVVGGGRAVIGGGRAVIFGGGKTVAVLDHPCLFLMIVCFFF